MILEGCQGKPRTPEILEKVCPQCGSEIELFTCDTQAVCEHCGFVVYNDTLSCVQWCKYAQKKINKFIALVYHKYYVSVSFLNGKECL